MSDILRKLAAPFPPSNVSWRVTTTSKDKSKGMVVCYIDARDVQRRLDLVMGYDWADELIVQPGLVTCKIGLYIDGSWRWRQDGTGNVREKLTDEALNIKESQEREMHLKGSVSDAFKRAAVKWGVGRYLYDIDSAWVQIDEYRNIKDSERPKLRGILERHYAEWLERNRQAPSAVPAAPSPQQVEQHQPAEAGDEAPEPGSHEPDEDHGAGEFNVADARKNNDFSRIEQLLARNVRTVGDVNRIINAPANLNAMKAWKEPWKEYMREQIRHARERAEKNRPAEAAA